MPEKMEEFVKLIEAYPCLYNHSLCEYSRKDFTEKAWAEISFKINWTVPECKEKWRNVRNGFVKSLKTPPSGSAAKSRKQYYLHDEMQFVIPFVKPTNNEKEPGNIPLCSQSSSNSPNKVEIQGTPTNEVETQRTPTNEELVDASSQPHKKKAKPSNKAVNSTFMQYITAKRQNMEKSMQKVDTENPRKMFLLSLLPDIEHLTDNNMRLLKIEMMSLIQKYHIAQQNRQLPATVAYIESQSNSEINQQLFQKPSFPVSSATTPTEQQLFQQTYSPVFSATTPNEQQLCQQLYSPISSAASPNTPNEWQPFQQPYRPGFSAMSPNEQGVQSVRSPLDYSNSRNESLSRHDLNQFTQYLELDRRPE